MSDNSRENTSKKRRGPYAFSLSKGNMSGDCRRSTPRVTKWRMNSRYGGEQRNSSTTTSSDDLGLGLQSGWSYNIDEVPTDDLTAGVGPVMFQPQTCHACQNVGAVGLTLTSGQQHGQDDHQSQSGNEHDECASSSNDLTMLTEHVESQSRSATDSDSHDSDSDTGKKLIFDRSLTLRNTTTD